MEERLDIFDYVKKAGGGDAAIVAAANSFHQSERNIQRIMSRPDVRRRVDKRDAFRAVLDAPFEEVGRILSGANETMSAELTAISSKALAKLRLVQQHLTKSERAELAEVSFPLVYELALSRHRAKRKHKRARK
jgi:hypothetical protein